MPGGSPNYEKDRAPKKIIDICNHPYTNMITVVKKSSGIYISEADTIPFNSVGNVTAIVGTIFH